MSARTVIVAVLFVLALTTGSRAAAAEEVFAFDPSRPAAGHWLGALGMDTGVSGFAAIFIEGGGEDEPWSIDLTCLPIGLIHQACTDVAIDGRAARFEVATRLGRLRVEAEISEDGQALSGTLALGDENAGGTAQLRRSPRPLDRPEPMAFTGALQAPGAAIEMAFVFAETPGGGLVGHVDVPVQGVRALPLVEIKHENGAIEAVLPVPGLASIEGRFDAGRRRFTGTFRQGPFNVEIDFTRDDVYASRDLPRPQHPAPPYPYGERSVIVAGGEGITLAGTLTVPDAVAHGAGPYPTAVLISGSGQQDRDETILGHKPFLVIADHLTRHGIAVMRFDDRGAGASTLDDPALLLGATSLDFAKDVLAIVRHLETVPEVDAKRIGLIGHSEGGMIGPLVTTMTDDIAFLVLLAGPGVRGRDILALQLALGLKANGGDPAAADRVTEHLGHAVDLVLEGADEQAVHDALVPAAEATMAASKIPPDAASVAAIVRSYQDLVSSPWAVYFLGHDPLPVLRAVTCPVLAMNGTLDLQVWHEQNLDAIDRAMTEAGGDITIRRYDGLNHLFQPAGTGSAAEYAAIETTFDERVLRDMTEWIEQRTGGSNDK